MLFNALLLRPTLQQAERLAAATAAYVARREQILESGREYEEAKKRLRVKEEEFRHKMWRKRLKEWVCVVGGLLFVR